MGYVHKKDPSRYMCNNFCFWGMGLHIHISYIVIFELICYASKERQQFEIKMEELFTNSKKKNS